jgi:hypothetical protein
MRGSDANQRWQRAKEKNRDWEGYNPDSSFHRPPLYYTLCTGAATWEEGIRIFQFRMLARFGLSNDERSGGYGTDRLIPLEELSARTLIIHMRAAIQIELMPKCNSACWAAHPLSSVKNDGRL